MKILFVFYVPAGGMETLNRQRCLALKQNGATCHLLYLNKGSGLQNILNINIPTFVSNIDDQIRALLQQENYDAVITTFDYMMLPRLRELGYEGTIIFEVQGLGNIEGAINILTNALPHITTHANAILLPKTPHLNKLVHAYYPDMKKYSFHNCIDTEHFCYRKLPVSPYPIIGWVGRIEYIKNWRYFLEICHELIQRVPSILIWTFEDKSLAVENEEFEHLIDQFKLTSHLIRHSNIPHSKMADYYSIIGDSGGVLCSTSILEGFGYAQLEAMLCRCPVVTTDSDGIKSFLKHNVTGKFIPHGNVQGAVKEILELMNDKKLRKVIHLNARKNILKHFSFKPYYEHFMGMLHDLGVNVQFQERNDPAQTKNKWWEVWK